MMSFNVLHELPINFVSKIGIKRPGLAVWVGAGFREFGSRISCETWVADIASLMLAFGD